MNVMRLLHAAVFMNAGSYVIIPNSSAVTLIWRMSVALIVPSWMVISYCLLVRLSVIVSVSAIRRFRILGQRLRRDAVAARQPPPQIGHLAALAAEGPPRGVHRLLPAGGPTHARRGGHTL